MEELALEMERVLLDQIGASDLNRMLVSAVKGGDLDIIGQLLDAGADVNCEVSGETPLGESKDGNVARFLISRGAKINLQKNYGDTPLLSILILRTLNDSSTNMKILKVLLQNGASVNGKEIEGERTPLMVAAFSKDSVAILQLLLDHGADINDQDDDGNTALYEAIRGNCFINVSFLLELHKEKNISINLQNHEGMTPLMRAVVNNNLEIVEQLIEFGADVNIKDKYGNTPLLHLRLEIQETPSEILTTLIRAGSDVNCQNIGGFSPLMFAAHYCWIKGLLILLDSGADVNAVSTENDSAKTALTFLTYIWSNHKNFKRCFEALVMKGASLSYINPGFLHKLTRNGDLVFIRELIQLGLGPTDVEAKWVGLDIAYTEQPPLVSPLYVALLEGNASLARFYLGNMFLTNLDITSLSGNWFLVRMLQYEDRSECRSILNEFSSRPRPLFLLAFMTVSSAVGTLPGREGRVNKLPVPQVMKDKLLFKPMCN